jgi:hypothetical protein
LESLGEKELFSRHIPPSKIEPWKHKSFI